VKNIVVQAKKVGRTKIFFFAKTEKSWLSENKVAQTEKGEKES
jgi:hypothetical protein